MANQFPDPSVTTDYIAPNGTQYSYDSIDKKWIPIGFVDPILPDINDDNQQIETIDNRYANVLGETLTGQLNVLEPVEDLNAASKEYVDNATTGDYLEHDGDTMKGLLNVLTPLEDNRVVTIDYVSNVIDDKVTKTGDEMTGTLIFEAEPTELEPVVYKFNPCTVELTERPGENVTTTLDLGTDLFKIDNNLELKDTGDFNFNSQVTFSDYVIIRNEFNLDNLLEVNRDTEDYITYQGPISFNKEIVTKEYVDKVYEKLTVSTPVGTIFFWISTNDIPEGYFKCDGSSFDTSVYPELHNILLGTYGYNAGRLPNYTNRYACHSGTPNHGDAGKFLSDTNSFTGTTNSKSMTMTAHKHAYTVSQGTHTHTYKLTGTGSHRHSYAAFGPNTDGGKTGTDKNPYVYYTHNDGPTMTNGTSNNHSHAVEWDKNSSTVPTHNHTHTVSINAKSNIGTHGHTLSYTNISTTRPLSFLGYWIIKNK